MSRVPSENKDALTMLRQSIEEKQRWQAEANAQGVSLSALVRHAVNEYLERRQKIKKKPKK